MLKALELNGFKSFADRTRFEFPEGITVVVGPNGSGKSNVVDAIKWVLGAQSVKALRGKEMTDVIFSGARGRAQGNSAEVSLILDNSAGGLDFDSEEVQITRRVYRSGESEYLINRQQCRLRDIKDVFAGTGMSTGAYSIIEQGKVDALLQSSPRERRLIFEEAAGISRFKQKRQEADRRLERIDQNLLRLSDIVEELDSRLRSVRSQAGKARKYKECSDRLKELRTQVGLTDWRSLSEKLQRAQGEFNELTEQKENSETSLASVDRQLKLVDATLDSLQVLMRDSSKKDAEVRERIAQCESTRRSQSARSEELQQESQRMQNQLLAMTSKAGSAQQLVAETSAALAEAETRFDELHANSEAQQQQLRETQDTLATIRQENDEARTQHAAAQSEVARLEHQIEARQKQIAEGQAEEARLSEELTRQRQTLSELQSTFQAANNALKSLEATANAAEQNLETAQDSLRRQRAQLAASQVQQADLRGRLTGAEERAVVLEELERRLDGLSSGTKEVLRLAKEEPNGPFGCVRGVVADLLRVDADTASLVEVALGDRANHLLVDRIDPLLQQLIEEEFPGRTSFLQLSIAQPASAIDQINLAGEAGVIGRADQFVETSPDLSVLPRRLLGRHWLVDSLATALRLSYSLGRGLNYVTVVGELVAADGTITVGPRQSTTGVLSRRSELRALLDEIREMQVQEESERATCARLEQEVAVQEQTAKSLAKEHQRAASKLGESKMELATLQHSLEQATQNVQRLEHEFEQLETSSSNAEESLTLAQQQLSNTHQRLDESSAQLEQGSLQAQECEVKAAELQKLVTDVLVDLARGEQRRDGLRRQMAQLEQDHEEHDRALVETKERVEQCHVQRRSLDESVLALTEELTQLYGSRGDSTRIAEFLQQEHDYLRQQRTEITSLAEQHREALSKLSNRLQRTEIAIEQLQNQRRELSERMQDDYDIDLALLSTQETEEDSGEREQVEQEIRQLRQQLQSIGPVNIEALNELEAIEERHSGLAQQYHDLQDAKDRLQQLVAKINVESREIFSQTLEVIRGHFQDMYRSLFGGGEADIIVDQSEDSDVLECGIEIVARPPGKQLRSISLLSGGERTMTCVALLLAIFRSRPSPFCVLDEVDAALDEANIDRFSDVLREFMATTQFIVISHSKRTMSCGDTLYGVTMQESGVSKRVSVRFEDVSADGKIRESKAA